MNGNKKSFLNSMPICSLTGFALSLVIPSMGTLQKYFGIIGVGVYVIFVGLVLLLGYGYIFKKFGTNITDRQVLYLSAATFIFLLVVFIVVYPLANSGILGVGSDRDEALNIATTELLKGHYPYYLKTYFGNPISPLPGSLVLAIPFVILGNSAYQNLLWLLVFLLSMNTFLHDKRLALLLLWLILALSPLVMQEFVTGGDYLANTIYVLLFTIWLINAIQKPRFGSWGKSFLAVLLGIGLSSRANFIFILPLIFSALVRLTGWKSAIKYISITSLTLGLTTVPFYLYDPQGFSPLHTANKLNQFQSILPYSGVIVLLATGIITFILSLSHGNYKLPVLLRNCAIVLVFPVLCGTILQSIKVTTLDFSFTYYGLPFVFFAALAFWSDRVWNNIGVAK